MDKPTLRGGGRSADLPGPLHRAATAEPPASAHLAPPLATLDEEEAWAGKLTREDTTGREAFLYRNGEGEFVPCETVPGPTMFIEGQLTTPWLEVNVRRLSAEQPMETVFRSRVCSLSQDLSGSHYPSYLTAWEHHGSLTPFAPSGPCNLIPANQTVRFKIDKMAYRKVTCLFDGARFDQFRDWEWNEAQLALCLDIRLPRVREGLLVLAREALEPGFASETLAESLVMGMIVELARDFRGVAAPQPKPGARLATWQLRLIRDQVENASGPAPAMTDLARACAVSPRHLARLFKNSTGTTLGAFIADARLRQAKALLARPEALIKAIAYQCGFRTPAAFAAAFRKATGRSPRQYRQDVLSTWR
ncbi:MAG: helix-turn-helix transcriptional regulator [Rhodocyclaceae bacterium]|nr:helix-turn-helix transcriptional regulator [Rhodocyclaceae bacterium]